MFIVGSWNIWGLNGLNKQKNAHEWAKNNNLDIFGLLETKVAAANLASIEPFLAPSYWKYCSNIHSSPTCRILVGWNSQKLNLTCIHSASQWLTCEVTQVSSPSPIRITFIYGHNNPAARLSLWEYLNQESHSTAGIPWIVLGDFNAILQANDRSGGDTHWPCYQDDFNACITQSELLQVPYSGLKYSWHNGQLGDNTIQKKLDWIFGNPCLFSTWPSAHANFQPRTISDHSAMVLQLQSHNCPRRTSFKFLNAWADRIDFLSIVQDSWSLPVNGNPMFQLTTKLQRLKIPLCQLHRQHTSSITSRVALAKAAWISAQFTLDENPTLPDARAAERHLASKYMQLCKDEESFFKQKSRVQWLHLGDQNTNFFHKSLLHRQVRNRIHSLQDEEGNLVHDQLEIGNMAAIYFERLLTTPHCTQPAEVMTIFPNKISEASGTSCMAPITNDDIKSALFSIPDNKSPGLDGYNALFFKKCWDIIKVDFIAAVRYFFSNNALPRCVNATMVTLVPKLENPTCMNDFRPISCCNVLYKCISKLIVNRLKEALTDVIGFSQSAFLPGRSISDAILLTQELMHNYHLNTGQGRCALKIDLKKAFDTVSWEYIIASLKAIAIPQEMINWITTCITSAHYSISLNGTMHGFFKSTRGIRQGDPLSPYIFVLAMEGLGGILHRAVQSPTFKYHWRCKPTNLTHLSFADDLMLFCHADVGSIEVLQKSLSKFSSLSGLTINHAKSKLYMSGIAASLRTTIEDKLGIQETTLPVKHLGVPLISTRLTHADCIPLVERITSRIKLWTSTSLTYAGRLQLIKSILFSIQVYWSSIFILPGATIKKIESILAAFLWKGTTLSTAGAKVAWSSICYPLQEGGLGIKRLKVWNRAATIKHIWRLLTNGESIWTSWVKKHLLRDISFWHINIPSNPSWSWRKILQSHDYCRGWFITSIGNGLSTSLWYDYWLPDGTRFIDSYTI